MEKYQLNCKNIHKLPGGSVTAVKNLLFYHGLSEAGQPVRIHEEKPLITQFMDKPGVRVSGREFALIYQKELLSLEVKFCRDFNLDLVLFKGLGDELHPNCTVVLAEQQIGIFYH